MSSFLSDPNSTPLIVLATTPLTFIVDRYFPSLSSPLSTPLTSSIRWMTSATISGFLLSLPLRYEKLQMGTMIGCVVCFVGALKTTQKLLFKDLREEKPKEEKKKERKNGVVREYISLIGEMFYPMLPLSSIPEEERRPMSELILTAFAETIFAGGKYLLHPFLHLLMLKLTSSAPYDELPLTLRSAVAIAWCINIITGTWMTDLMSAWVPVLTFGHWRIQAFHSYPALSSNVGDFWGKRYNLVISSFLRSAVYVPLRSRQVTPSLSASAAFFASGVLHSYVAHFTFGTGATSSLFFFLAHALALSLERSLPQSQPHSLFSRVLTHPIGGRCVLWATMWSTFSLYPGLFMRAMPQFLTGVNALPASQLRVVDWAAVAIPGVKEFFGCVM